MGSGERACLRGPPSHPVVQSVKSDEGLRRVSDPGAERVIAGGGQKFYQSIGFEKTVTCYGWTREF